MRVVRSWAFAAAIALLPVSRAEQVARIPRVGFLSPGTAEGKSIPAFREALATLGWVDGRNVVIEPRFAAGQGDRYPKIAAEVVGLNVDVVVVIGAITLRAARQATTRIPIVFDVVVDPVAAGIVPNLERPGGNATGITTFDPQQPRNQLEILKAALPGLRRVAILGDRNVAEALLSVNEKEARALGLEVIPLRIGASTPGDVDGALERAVKERAGALVVLEEPAVFTQRKRIFELAAKARLPTVFAPDWVDAGGLLAYGTSVVGGARRMAMYVDRILKGARPGDLPVEAVRERELIVNLKTARELGVSIPSDVLKRATRVIE